MESSCKMSPIVPYKLGMKLGWTVQKEDLSHGSPFIKGELKTEPVKINEVLAHFSFPSSLEELCQVLEIDSDYAIKVEAGLIKNDIVASCLEHLYDKKYFTAIFRVCYTHGEEKLINPSKESNTSSTFGETQTHFIRSISNGNELVVIMKLSSDSDAETDYRDEFFDDFDDNCNDLDDKALARLEKCVIKLEKRLKTKKYSDVKSEILYGSTFNQLDEYPNTGSGMLQVITNFKKKCDGYEEYYINNVPTTLRGDVFVNIVRGTGVTPDPKTQNPKEKPEESSEEYPLHYTRANLEPVQTSTDENSCESHMEQVATLCKHFREVKIAEERYLEFQGNRDLCYHHYTAGQEVRKNITKRKERILDFTKSLDWSNRSCEDALQLIGDSDALKNVTDFIETVTTKLPPGKDKVMMAIGKTGNGKSATSNLIIGAKKFMASPDQESVTKTSKVVQKSVDGRALKIVDTPGICDTTANTDEKSIKMAIEGISQAITQCAEGFDALLMVIRYGVRMTEEEKKAVEQLKGILGSQVIQTHCIIVITYKDNYVKDHGSLDFMMWCQKQTGFLGELFKEVSYRCVLFDNTSDDPLEMKSMVIDLISMVDKIQTVRYTSSLFQYASAEREQLLTSYEWDGLNNELMNEVLKYQELVSKLNVEDGVNVKERIQSCKDAQNKIEEKIKSKSLWKKFKEFLAPIFSSNQEVLNTKDAEWKFIQQKQEEIAKLKAELDEKIDEVDKTVKKKVQEELERKNQSSTKSSWCVIS